ncbi:MAG: AAA family ATPase [Candidatus Izemoplasmatales bacterium]|jgi:AAA15 family ATPase/GTPase
MKSDSERNYRKPSTNSKYPQNGTKCIENENLVVILLRKYYNNCAIHNMPGDFMGKNEYSVRIESILLKNFKNIGNGEVFFSEFNKFKRKEFVEEGLSNVIGIYGQNASGKTSVINALSVVRHLLCGRGMTQATKNYIKKGNENFQIVIVFLLSNKQNHVLTTYSVDIGADKKNLYIDNETLSFSKLNPKTLKFGNKQSVYSYSREKSLKESFVALIESKEDKTIINYLTSQKTKLDINNSSSVIFSSLFNNEVISIVSRSNKLKELFEIMQSLIQFCKNKFLIVTTNLYDGISDHGVGMNGFDVDENQERIHKNFDVLFGRQVLEKKKYFEFEKMLKASSAVLEALVPGLQITLHKFNELFDSSGRNAVEFQVMSLRGGIEIPLYYESRGVKQMLTYVGDLIGVFNEEGTFIAIDELDSGIFEYLLGEIVYSFDNFASGQMLFTSHNFRVLERIKSNGIFFATANENNKFVRPKFIKNNNNLRDVYYRLIAQGDNENIYYNKTSYTDIIKTLRLLGSSKK